MPSNAWVGTDHTYRVPAQVDRIPDFDPRSGDHLWTIITMYRWGGPEVEEVTLDQENLLSVMGPGCYYCEQAYSPQCAKRRCKGISEGRQI